MKTIIQLSCLLITVFSFTIKAQGQEGISFYQSIKAEGANLAILECAGPVEVKVWDEDYILVHTNISCAGVKANALRSFAVDGRYELVAEMNFNNFLTITQPKLAEAIMVNHQSLREQIQYTVYLPVQLDVEIDAPNNLTTAFEIDEATPPSNPSLAYQK